jgi:hypothetical protein
VRGSSGAEVRKQPGSRSNPELPLDQAIRCSKAVSSLGPSVSGSLTVFEIVSQLEVLALYGDAAVLIASSRPTETAGRSGTGFSRESRTMCSSNSSVKASAVQERRAKSTFSFDILRSMSRVTRNRRFPCKAEASEERRLVGRTPYPRQGEGPIRQSARPRTARVAVREKNWRAGRRGVDLSTGPDRVLGGLCRQGQALEAAGLLG